jgi:RNA polymerase sigma factor (sigma-70 family)
MERDRKKFYDDLYKDNHKKLKRYAYRITGNYELVPDLIQEAFLLLFVNIDHVIAHPTPVGWLYKTLKHICLKANKAAGANKEIPLIDAIDVSYNMLDAELGDSLLEILPAKLAEEDRKLLIWRYKERLSTAEIANRLGLKEWACFKRISRAEERCKNLLLQKTIIE